MPNTVIFTLIVGGNMQFDLFGNSVQSGQCSVTADNGTLRVKAPYDSRFVALVKLLPTHARRFDPDSKAWLIDPLFSKQIQEWIYDVYGETVGIPVVTAGKPELRILDVWYLAKTKPAGDENAASGMNKAKQWVFVFPERVLREWFNGTIAEIMGTTLYGVLGIQRGATDEEIRSAYRRMVKQWHPDVCKEPNAQEMFIKIREAYELLSDPIKRAKYDAGLVLSATLPQQQILSHGYRAPLRCGYVLAEGMERVGRFYVSKILRWEDIVENGKTLVASWPIGVNEPIWIWT